MNQTKLCLAGALLALLAICTSAQTYQRTARYISPADGLQLYAKLCASCHGSDFRGSPTAAAAINPPPADLTKIAVRNQGVFPEARVYESIGNREGHPPMPNRSSTLNRMYGGEKGKEHLAISNLVKLIESRQGEMNNQLWQTTRGGVDCSPRRNRQTL